MINVSCSRTTTQGRRWGSNPLPLGLESSTLPLSHCAPYIIMVSAIYSRNSRHEECSITTRGVSECKASILQAYLFVWFDSLRPINNFSFKQGRVFLGWTSTRLTSSILLKNPLHWSSRYSSFETCLCQNRKILVPWIWHCNL